MNRISPQIFWTFAASALLLSGCVGRVEVGSSGDNADPETNVADVVDSRPLDTPTGNDQVGSTDWTSFGKPQRLVLPFTPVSRTMTAANPGPTHLIKPGVNGTAPQVFGANSTAPGFANPRYLNSTSPGFNGPNSTAPGVRSYPIRVLPRGANTTAPGFAPNSTAPGFRSLPVRGLAPNATAPGFRPAFTPPPIRGGATTAPGIRTPGFRPVRVRPNSTAPGFRGVVPGFDPNGRRSPNTTFPR